VAYWLLWAVYTTVGRQAVQGAQGCLGFGKPTSGAASLHALLAWWVLVAPLLRHCTC
jgi:hypothetical protein